MITNMVELDRRSVRFRSALRALHGRIVHARDAVGCISFKDGADKRYVQGLLTELQTFVDEALQRDTDSKPPSLV